MNKLAEPTIAYAIQELNWQIPKNILVADIIYAPMIYSQDLEIFISFEHVILGTITSKPSFNFSWEGGLKELNKNFDGVKLQHHINTLRK